jgi:hypothetical protein
VCVCLSGGPTGIHSKSSVMEGNSFLICCADSIFCLALPDLNLTWITKADQATTGQDVFKLNDDVIEVVSWDGIKVIIDAQTGKPIKS